MWLNYAWEFQSEHMECRHSLFPWLIKRLKVEVCTLIRISLADVRIQDCHTASAQWISRRKVTLAGRGFFCLHVCNWEIPATAPPNVAFARVIDCVGQP